MDLNAYLVLMGFILVNAAVASSGAFFRPGAWYRQIAKPSWTPPNWLFGPAWSILYATIAVAGWLVWFEAGFDGAAVPLTIYAAQLVFNALWSWLFFGLRRPDMAFAEGMMLWASVLATILAFYPVQPGAAYLLIPYLLWVSFAMVLNFTIWRLNRQPVEA